MHLARRNFLSSLIATGLLACATRTPPASSPSTWTASPHDVFGHLVQAIVARDLDDYLACFAEESRESEAEGDKLERDPRAWDELNAIFRGPLTLNLDEVSDRPTVGVTVHGQVDAPEAAQGGIGGMTFVLTEQGWRVKSW